MNASAWVVAGVFTLGALAGGCGGKEDGIGQAAAGEGGEGPLPQGSAGEGGGAPAPECAALDDESGEMLTVRVVNAASKAIYLGVEEMTCESSLGWRFELVNKEGKRFGAPGNCQSCSDWTTSGPAGCPTICLTMPALALQAGEQVDLPWDGLVSSRVELPAACVVNEDLGSATHCTHAARAQAGEYTLTARAGTALKCDEAAAECSACQPREAGGCESRELVESLVLEATLDVTLGSGPDFDVAGPLELVFSD